MKKFIQLILAFTIVVCMASCKGEDGEDGAPGPAGPAGAPGPTGPQGPAGASADSAQVFDITEEASFTAANQYTLGLRFNVDAQLGPADIMLAYRFVGTLPDSDIPFWSPLPLTYTVNAQSLTYNFAYSSTAFFITLVSQADLAGADFTNYTTNQAFRFVIIPGRAGRTAGAPLTKADLSKYPVDLNDYNAVVKYFKINDSNVRKIKLK